MDGREIWELGGKRLEVGREECLAQAWERCLWGTKVGESRFQRGTCLGKGGAILPLPPLLEPHLQDIAPGFFLDASSPHQRTVHSRLSPTHSPISTSGHLGSQPLLFHPLIHRHIVAKGSFIKYKSDCAPSLCLPCSTPCTTP